MKIYHINYFAFGDKHVALVAAISENQAKSLLEIKYDDEDEFNIDSISEYNTDFPSVLYIHYAEY